MEKVAAGGATAATSGGVRRGRWPAAVGVALCAAGPGAWADDAAPTLAEPLAQARAEQPAVRLQVQASALPRLEAQDSGFQAPRVDFSVFPANSRGVGAVVGMTGFSGQPQPLGLAPLRPSIDLGVRWSHKQLDVMAWRRMNTADDAYTLLQMREPVYGARVEMNIKPAKPGVFGFDRGFIGLQLQSGARISIKRKDGRPMVYYRTTF